MPSPRSRFKETDILLRSRVSSTGRCFERNEVRWQQMPGTGQSRTEQGRTSGDRERRGNGAFVGLRLNRKLSAGIAGILLSCWTLASAASAPSELTLQIRDFLTMPDPGKRDPESQNFSAYS